MPLSRARRERKEGKQITLDGLKSFSMLGARAMPSEPGQMLGGAVALVLGELILRIEAVKLHHVRVALNLGEN